MKARVRDVHDEGFISDEWLCKIFPGLLPEDWDHQVLTMLGLSLDHYCLLGEPDLQGWRVVKIKEAVDRLVAWLPPPE
jgi:hypothetical protein